MTRQAQAGQGCTGNQAGSITRTSGIRAGEIKKQTPFGVFFFNFPCAGRREAQAGSGRLKQAQASAWKPSQARAGSITGTRGTRAGEIKKQVAQGRFKNDTLAANNLKQQIKGNEGREQEREKRRERDMWQ